MKKIYSPFERVANYGCDVHSLKILDSIQKYPSPQKEALYVGLILAEEKFKQPRLNLSIKFND